MKNNKKIDRIIYLVAAICFYIAAAINFFGMDKYVMGTVYLCLGTTWLCLRFSSGRDKGKKEDGEKKDK